MKWIRFCCVAWLGFALTQTAQAEEKLDSVATGPDVPVLAWAGIPSNESTPERMRELADAGFTLQLSSVPNAAEMEKLLDLAHAHGIKLFITIPELASDPQGTAKRFKDHPAVAGYNLRDEPGAGLFAKLGEWTKQIQSVDAVHPCYVNLFPTYGNPGQWETPTYEKYVERFLNEVPVPMLSFDHYPVIRTGADAATDALRPDFYYNLEVCSKAAQKAKRPLWAFVLATAHTPYPIPTIAHLRVQAFSDLAYGAQVIQYFTYWTVKSDVWNFHQGPIEVDGTRTKTYDRVKQVNGEIQALRGVFMGSHVISVGHTGKLPQGTTVFAPAAPIESLDTEGTGAAVSLLEKGDRRFLVVVNRDIHKPMPLTIAFDAKAGVQQAGKDGAVKPIGKATYKAAVEPGDVAVFTWRK